MFGNSLVAAQLAASQEGLNSMELVSYSLTLKMEAMNSSVAGTAFKSIIYVCNSANCY
jgi:hypothetical protein